MVEWILRLLLLLNIETLLPNIETNSNLLKGWVGGLGINNSSYFYDRETLPNVHDNVDNNEPDPNRSNLHDIVDNSSRVDNTPNIMTYPNRYPHCVTPPVSIEPDGLPSAIYPNSRSRGPLEGPLLQPNMSIGLEVSLVAVPDSVSATGTQANLRCGDGSALASSVDSVIRASPETLKQDQQEYKDPEPLSQVIPKSVSSFGPDPIQDLSNVSHEPSIPVSQDVSVVGRSLNEGDADFWEHLYSMIAMVVTPVAPEDAPIVSIVSAPENENIIYEHSKDIHSEVNTTEPNTINMHDSVIAMDDNIRSVASNSSQADDIINTNYRNPTELLCDCEYDCMYKDSNNFYRACAIDSRPYEIELAPQATRIISRDYSGPIKKELVKEYDSALVDSWDGEFESKPQKVERWANQGLGTHRQSKLVSDARSTRTNYQTYSQLYQQAVAKDMRHSTIPRRKTLIDRRCRTIAGRSASTRLVARLENCTRKRFHHASGRCYQPVDPIGTVGSYIPWLLSMLLLVLGFTWHYGALSATIQLNKRYNPAKYIMAAGAIGVGIASVTMNVPITEPFMINALPNMLLTSISLALGWAMEYAFTCIYGLWQRMFGSMQCFMTAHERFHSLTAQIELLLRILPLGSILTSILRSYTGVY